MKDREDGPGGYVRRVQENLHRYTEDILGENEKLRLRVAELEAEKSGLELHLQQIEEASRRFKDEYANVQQQNANLANLYVASYRLHGTAERKEVVLAIQEIVANLIGSEELAIFEREPGSAALSLVASFGVDETPLRDIAVGSGIIGRAAATGEIYVRGEADAGIESPAEEVTACIPLSLDGQVTAVIAIFRLLSHKPALEAADRELFDLLASQAAVALYCARLHLQHGWGAVAAPAAVGTT